MRFSPWRLLLGLLDAALTGLAVFVSATVHFTGNIPPPMWDALQLILPITMGLMITCNHFFGLYNRVWRYAGIETAMAVGASTTLALVVAALVGKYTVAPLPIAVWYTTWLFCLFALSSSRFFWRIVRPALDMMLPNGARDRNTSSSNGPRILIYGAGLRGCSLSHTIGLQAASGYRIVGFVDDDPQKRSSHVGEHRVLGSGEDLAELVKRHRVDEVIVAIADLSRPELREILLRCREAKVKAKIMPSLLETMGRQLVQPREINVDDLLGREIPVTGIALHEDYISGKTVLVTGAGGSIGSELSRQVCRYNPKCLILLGRGENRIHWIYLELKERYPHRVIHPVIQNVTSSTAMDRLFARHRPDIVFHAAAHKHVYLMEHVPVEAARNNVIGTKVLADLASKYGVAKFVFISTDKAVAPTSVMGATKRACELMLMNRPAGHTSYICVRFGNVLGSEGSVLEIFKRQWRQGKPLTITAPDASRYFMSIPEASFLVLQAGALGDHGDIFVFDMGQPVLVGRLAEEFILLNGGNPHDPTSVKVTGLTEGEKLHESLRYEREELLPTASPQVMKVTNANAQDAPGVALYLGALQKAVVAEDNNEVVRILNAFTDGAVKSTKSATTSEAV
jgi:FlaA1/EpsC-like NDP-sugar epimerase